MTGPNAGIHLDRRARIRRATMTLMLGILALHALALAVYFAGGVAAASPRTQRIFSTIWLAVTAVAVAVLLHRVRVARRG